MQSVFLECIKNGLAKYYLSMQYLLYSLMISCEKSLIRLMLIVLKNES